MLSLIRSRRFVLGAKLCLLAISFYRTPAIQAQDTVDLFDDGDVPIILSASRLIQPQSSSPASITVIDSEMIRLSGARTIVDALRLAPGFQVGRLVNGNPIATRNGISERYNPRLQLIVDGRPTYVPLYGGIPWSELPIALSDIERIEITRAPNAATFGPNSFTAVVSIITRAPASRAGWSTHVEAGGNDYRTGTLTYHGGGDDFNYRFTLQSERDEGFRGLPDKERSKLASIRTRWQLDPNNRLVADLGGVKGGHTEVNTVLEPYDLVGYTDTTNAYAQLVWEHSKSTDDTIRLQYYFNYFDIQDNSNTPFPADQVLGDPSLAGETITAAIDRDSRSKRHEIELQKSMRLNARHRLAFGGALRQDSVQGRFLFNDFSTRFVSTQRLFAQSEFTLKPQWMLNSGLMLENHTIGKVSVSPRISLSHQYRPGHTLRLSHSRGTRTPLLLEQEGIVSQQYPTSLGLELNDLLIVNVDKIEPETIDVVDLGYYLNNRQRGFSLDAKLSWHHMRDLISTQILPDPLGDTFDGVVRAYRNRFSYRFSTFELQIDHRPTRNSLIRAAYTHSFAQDAVLERRQLLPENTLTLFASLGVGRETTLSGEYQAVSYWIWDDTMERSKLNRLDLRVEKRLKFSGLRAAVALQAELDLGGTSDYLERNRIDDLYFARLSVELP